MVPQAVFKAREEFLSQGTVKERFCASVRPEILRSWRRSLLGGARSDAETMPVGFDPSPETRLMVAAEPVLSRLADQLSTLHAGVLLSDRHARIIRRWASDPGIIKRMDQVVSAVGSSGSEELIGTNGIGTVAEEHKPYIVVGPEHFAEILTQFTCVGVPIRHPMSRKFQGVVTLNTNVEAASPLLLPFVISTAQEIELRLLEQSSLRERTLLDTFLKASARGAASAVIGEEVFIVGPRAARLLRDIDPAVVWPQLLGELSARSKATRRVIETPSGSLAVRVVPVVVDHQIFGALLDVVPEDRPIMHGGSGFGHVDVAVVAANHAGHHAAPTAGGWRNGHASLPGTSRVWTSILASAAAQIEGTIPLLITGEVGTGKLSLVRAIHDQRGLDEADLHIADCAMANDAWLDQVDAALSNSGKTLVLRHVDLADGTTAKALSALLDFHLQGGERRMFATAAPTDLANVDPVYRRLVDHLSMARLDLPPLRQRSEDIPALIDQISARYATHTLSVDSQALAALKRAPWPGNIRQLETTVHGLVNMARGRTVTIDMLPSDVAVYSKRRTLTPMEQMEFEAILSALSCSRGNKMIAARMLGIARSTLYRKMTSYQLDPDLKFF